MTKNRSKLKCIDVNKKNRFMLKINSIFSFVFGLKTETHGNEGEAADLSLDVNVLELWNSCSCSHWLDQSERRFYHNMRTHAD